MFSLKKILARLFEVPVVSAAVATPATARFDPVPIHVVSETTDPIASFARSLPTAGRPVGGGKSRAWFDAHPDLKAQIDKHLKAGTSYRRVYAWMKTQGYPCSEGMFYLYRKALLAEEPRGSR